MKYDNEEDGEIATCACCGSTEIGERFAGDEGWTICSACGAIEQGYEYITIKQAEEEGLI